MCHANMYQNTHLSTQTITKDLMMKSKLYCSWLTKSGQLFKNNDKINVMYQFITMLQDQIWTFLNFQL